MFSRMQSIAVHQFKELDAQYRLVIVHPHFLQQHVLLTHFLDQPMAYVRFEGSVLNQAQLQEQFRDSLANQGLATDLQPKTVLILDECDRANSTDLTTFVRWLLENVNSLRIVILTRLIPKFALEDTSLQALTAFIPDEASGMLWDYTSMAEDTSLLEVRAFGTGHVLLDGREIDTWDGLLPRALFFYLVDRGMATRNEIFETFWPNLPKREATNVFHVTKRKISEVLGIDLTTYWSGFYRISPDIRLSYDAILFTEIIQNSAVAPAQEAIMLLEQAIALYRSPFLNAMDNPWAKRRRYEVALDYSEALISLARAKEELGDLPEALGLYQQAAAHSDRREEVILNIMRLLHQLGMNQDALSIYHSISENGQANGTLPNAQLQDLAARIQKGSEQSPSK